MRVYFIGAGPGAADLITVRGAALLRRSKVVLYAGSLVPQAILEYCPADAEIVNTAQLDLDQQMTYYINAQQQGLDVARLHSGDPAIYGATAEQMRRLDAAGISYEIVPGVSSFTAAAASIGAELTKPLVSQSIIITRVSGRASAVPEKEALSRLAEHQATMCIFLSGPHLKEIVSDLLIHYSPDTPVALVFRATWPDERKHCSTLGKLLQEVNIQDWKLTTMMLVGQCLSDDQAVESCLYSSSYKHLFRKGAGTAQISLAGVEV